jgi:outer membrane protein assembly factor BamE
MPSLPFKWFRSFRPVIAARSRVRLAGAAPRAPTLAMTLPIILALLLAGAGCSMPRLPNPHVVPIQQGNVIEQDSLAKLKPGMTRSQVRFALGTPLIVDVFRQDRWDYVYTLKRQGEPLQQRRVTVVFDGDSLLRLEGDVVAGSGTAAPVRPSSRAGDPKAAAASAPAAAAAAPVEASRSWRT